MKFADIDVAKYFSHETMVPEISGITFIFINGAEAIVNIQNFKIKKIVAELLQKI
jgi:hypothetical protein